MSPAEITPLMLKFLREGDIEGLSSIYEEDAVLVTAENGAVAKGLSKIKEYFGQLLKQHPNLDSGIIKTPVVNGNIAMTSSVLSDGRVTAEIARQQTDGSWKWCLDNPLLTISAKQ